MCVLVAFFLLFVFQQKWRRRRHFESQSQRSPQAPAALRRLRGVVTRGDRLSRCVTAINVDWLRGLRRRRWGGGVGGACCLGLNWVLKDAADCSVEARQRREITLLQVNEEHGAAPRICVYPPSLKAGNAEAALGGPLAIF